MGQVCSACGHCPDRRLMSRATMAIMPGTSGEPSGTLSGAFSNDFRVSAGVLDLSSRELGSIPVNLSQSVNARSVIVLKLQNNRLKRLAHLGEFKSLLRINLCSNSIVSLDDIMGELSAFGRLTDLLLRNNEITKLSFEICRLRNLEMLDLKGNAISLVPEPLSYLRELRYLNLSRNRISKCSSLRNLNALNFLDLSHNSLKVLPDDFLVGAHQIKHLNLSHNALMHIPQQMFSLATLLDLNLSHNAIVNLPDRVCELVAIRNLDLSYNRLNELPEKKLISMINLTTLNIRHNLIYLPQRFHLITDASIVLQFLSVSQFTNNVSLDSTDAEVDHQARSSGRKAVQRRKSDTETILHMPNDDKLERTAIASGSKAITRSEFLKRQLQISLQPPPSEGVRVVPVHDRLDVGRQMGTRRNTAVVTIHKHINAESESKLQSGSRRMGRNRNVELGLRNISVRRRNSEREKRSLLPGAVSGIAKNKSAKIFTALFSRRSSKAILPQTSLKMSAKSTREQSRWAANRSGTLRIFTADGEQRIHSDNLKRSLGSKHGSGSLNTLITPRSPRGRKQQQPELRQQHSALMSSTSSASLRSQPSFGGGGGSGRRKTSLSSTGGSRRQLLQRTQTARVLMATQHPHRHQMLRRVSSTGSTLNVKLM